MQASLAWATNPDGIGSDMDNAYVGTGGVYPPWTTSEFEPLRVLPIWLPAKLSRNVGRAPKIDSGREFVRPTVLKAEGTATSRGSCSASGYMTAVFPEAEVTPWIVTAGFSNSAFAAASIAGEGGGGDIFS